MTVTAEQRAAILEALGRSEGTAARQQEVINQVLNIEPQQAGGPLRRAYDAVVENVVGRGEVDTPGERLGQTINEMGRAFFPGVARGAAELAGLPGTISDLTDIPFERMGLLPGSEGSPFSGSSIRGLLNDATGGATEHRGETTAGRIAGTVGEFLPGAGGAGVRGLLAHGVTPGVASEAAGMATEGTALEPYARVAAALGAGVVAGPALGIRSPTVRTPGANSEQRQMAEFLQSQGIQPTAGQTSGSNFLRRIEGTASARPDQIEDVTGAAMRSIGSTANRATPATLRAANAQIVDTMDAALAGVSITPTTSMAQNADDVVRMYLVEAPSATVVPRVRAMADEIIEAATNPTAAPIDLTTLRTWRSALGRLSQSNDEATRTAAHGLRRIIDDATDTALTAAGRSDDLSRLSQAREQYRNFLAVSDASTRAGSEAGVLSPAQLNQSIIRTQGREAYAVGRGTGLMETSRASGELLRSMPTVEAGGIRRLPYMSELGAGGAGAAMGAALGGMPGAVTGGLIGAALPPVGQALMRSRQVQSLLMNPQFAAGNATRAAPGLLANQPN